MKQRNDESLRVDVLQVAHLSKFPAKMSKKTALWVEAIAKIRKKDGTYGYGILKHNEKLESYPMYINGTVAAIDTVEEIYPYLVLDKGYIQTFDNDEVQPRIEYLKSLNLPYAKDGEFDNMDAEQLNEQVVKAAMYQQIFALNEEE